MENLTGDSISPAASPELRFYSDFHIESKSIPLDYAELPADMKSELDDLAASLLDPNGGQVFVTGEALSGKSFLIEQLAYNIDHYLQMSEFDRLQWVRVSHEQATVVNNFLPNQWSDYLESACQAYDVDQDEVVFVTESVYAANGLAALGVKVILECSVKTLVALYQTEDRGTSKSWSAWSVIDASRIFLKKKSLVTMLSMALLEGINARFRNLNFQPKHIQIFVNYAIKHGELSIEDEESPELKTATVVPPGVWAREVSRLASILAVDSSMKNAQGTAVFTRAVEKVYSESSHIFAEYRESYDSENDDFGNMADLVSALQEAHPGAEIRVHGMPPGLSTAKEKAPELGLSEHFSDIRTLKERLGSVIFGQEEALDAVVRGMKIPAAGLNLDTKPVRSLLFLGPTGVGKTQLAQTLSTELMQEEIPLVRIDMSEFAHEHEVARLYGAPPGYKGHEAGGVLTNAVKKNPRSIILLDEIEKAHPQVWDAFLQILDAGRMTDGSGMVVDFTKTIVILTSNLGAEKAMRQPIGYMGAAASTNKAADRRATVLKAVEETLRPEMINRLDQMVVFEALSPEVIIDVVARELELVKARVASMGYVFADVERPVLEHIASLSDVSKYGAREIQRTVSSSLFEKVADSIIDAIDTSIIEITLGEDGIQVTTV